MSEAKDTSQGQGRQIGGRVQAGAPGGYWEAIEEAPHPDAVQQLSPTSCGPACGEMLFKSRGVAGIVQRDIIEIHGHLTYNDTLAPAMNQLQQQLESAGGGMWRGGWLDTLHNPREAFGYLARHGPFATSLKSFDAEAHMVVVDGMDDAGRVIVRDPFEGTRYYVEWVEFLDVWHGISVWWSTESES